MRKAKTRLLKFIDVIQRFSSFEGSLFRYSLSYSFLLALFPTLIVIVLLFQHSILDIARLFSFLYRFIPQEFLQPFIDFLLAKNYHSFLSIAISSITGFYFASRSIYSFMLICAKDENFNIPKILIRIKSYALFIVLVVSVTILSLLSSIFEYHLLSTFGIGLFILLTILYRTIIFEKKPWHYGIIGSLFSTIAILFASMLFFRIIDYFSTYGNIYGPMASLLTMMLSIYVVSCIVFFGYCLNVVYGPRYLKREYKNERYYAIGKKLVDKVVNKIKGVI